MVFESGIAGCFFLGTKLLYKEAVGAVYYDPRCIALDAPEQLRW